LDSDEDKPASPAHDAWAEEFDEEEETA